LRLGAGKDAPQRHRRLAHIRHHVVTTGAVDFAQDEIKRRLRHAELIIDVGFKDYAIVPVWFDHTEPAEIDNEALVDIRR
jgi:hypothetical protein